MVRDYQRRYMSRGLMRGRRRRKKIVWGQVYGYGGCCAPYVHSASCHSAHAPCYHYDACCAPCVDWIYPCGGHYHNGCSRGRKGAF